MTESLNEYGAFAAGMRWLALIVLVCCLAGVAGCYLTYVAPARLGMCQGSTAGVAGWVWVKCPDR